MVWWLLLLLCCPCLRAGTVWAALYSKVERTFCQDYESTKYWDSPTKVVCANECYSEETCSGFCFSVALHTCRIYGSEPETSASLVTDSSSYVLEDEEVSYEDAVQLCSDRGGHPAAPTSDVSNELIKGLISDKTWIGVRKWNGETRLESTGLKIQYDNFDLFEGIIGWSKEDCVYMNVKGKWKDTSCSDEYSALCETSGTAPCDEDNGDASEDSYECYQLQE